MAPAVARRLSASTAWSGRVHSVFDRTVNALGSDGRLLTLQGPGLLSAPFAIALEGPPPGEIEPGASVERIGGRLDVGGIAVDWRRAQPIDLSIGTGSDLAGLAAALHRVPPSLGAPALCSARALEARRAVRDGIARDDAERFAVGALALIGLGEGLTPAGDDCLVGILAVLRSARPHFLTRHPGLAGTIAGAAQVGTTIVAREFLRHALDGDFSEALVALVRASSCVAARDAAERLTRMGATSGADTLTGTRLALDALRPR